MVKSVSTAPETHLAGAIPNACRKLLHLKPRSVKAHYKKKKASFMRSLLDYLTSDSFMYGPLLSPPPPPKKPSNVLHASPVSQIEEHGGASTLSSLHSPSTPISRLRSMSTLTKRFLGRVTLNNDEHGAEGAAPASCVKGHRNYKEETLVIPSLKHKEKVNGDGTLTSQGDDDEEANEDEEDESSKSFTGSQSEYDVTPLHKDAAMEVARRLVRRLGGRLSKELGIFVDVRDSEVERWFLATTFLSHPSDFEIAKQMFKKLQTLGISKIQDVLGIDQRELEEAFQSVMHNHRIASRLQKIALALHDEHHGGICTLKRVAEYSELKRDLECLPGYSRNAARIFIREMRGIWAGANPDFEIRTRNAAKHLHLLSSGKDAAEATSILVELGQDTGLDVRDLELALVKLSFQHARHYRNCSGGRECDFVRITLSDVDRLIVSL